MHKFNFIRILSIVLLAVSGIVFLSVFITEKANFNTSKLSYKSDVSGTAQRLSISPLFQNIVQVDNGIEIEEKYPGNQNKMLLAKEIYPDKIMIDQGIMLDDQSTDYLND